MNIINLKRDTSLSLSDNVIYSWIKGVEDFNLTNEKMAEELGVSVSLIQQSLKRLRAIKIVYNDSFNGHRRVLKTKESK